MEVGFIGRVDVVFFQRQVSFNPCFNGSITYRQLRAVELSGDASFNPCSNGSITYRLFCHKYSFFNVLRVFLNE